ncbi:hypothetical protein GCM10010261_41130 [Streptomyces pilosus]|uniref:Uncharacterized protein n=1 Tax=Streptomyces pilosus TaxID=28893 RepID=A0A918BRU1_9ACTN|nr:hypothetical protein GCM10010280_39320 [Streptomyces pilosus]GGV56225.1 hypothetical protein GCM10010261_41130 [Streptomyces pilosus]
MPTPGIIVRYQDKTRTNLQQARNCIKGRGTRAHNPGGAEDLPAGMEDSRRLSGRNGADCSGSRVTRYPILTSRAP